MSGRGTGGSGSTAERPHIPLRELRPQVYLDGIYSLINPQIGTTRGQKPYFKALLRDSTGEVPVRAWTFDPASFHDVSRTGFVWVSGQAQSYNGQVQVIAEVLRAATVEPRDLARLLPSTSGNIDAMHEEVVSILRSMGHPAMRALVEQYLGNAHLMKQFMHAPAAVSVHHAWIGGLLEHTLQVLRAAEALLPLYPELNRDIVLMGLFLHDLGKTVELEWEKGFNYTADGNLIGHAVRGAIWLQAFATAAARDTGQKLPAEALRVLQHILISHHGSHEFGAVKVPSTPEAVFVAMLDNLDARTAIALHAADRPRGDSHEPGHDFTDKVWALDTRIYRPDPLEAPPVADAPPAAEAPPATAPRPDDA
ncbi:MAG: HD domain-containing protein, partial [Phycisphaerae bacterium]|nr:HD domain-containing protein [Phycisphaerae bacterium]